MNAPCCAALFAVALCFSQTPVTAQTQEFYVNGNALNDWCQSYSTKGISSEEWMDAGHCLGYVAGVVDALGGTPQHFCLSAVVMNQLIDVTKLYLRDHPETRHLPAAELVRTAIAEKFPCN